MQKLSISPMKALKYSFNGLLLAGLAYGGFRAAELGDSNAKIITQTSCAVTDTANRTKTYVFPAPMKSGVRYAWEGTVDTVTSWWTGKTRPDDQTREGATIASSHMAAWMRCGNYAEQIGNRFASVYAVSEVYEKNSLLMRLVDPGETTFFGQKLDHSGKLTAQVKADWAARAVAVEQSARILQGPPAVAKDESMEMKAAQWAVAQGASRLGL